MQRNEKPLIDKKADIKLVLAGLWIALMLLYVYCDIFSFYRTGQLEKMMMGKMGFLDVGQITLLTASLLMIVPTLMIIVSLALPARPNRAVNITAGILYALVNIGNIIGEKWAYYIVFGLLETVIIGIILYRAIVWPREILNKGSARLD